MALGNYLGGHTADRAPRQQVLAGFLLGAGALCLAVSPLHRLLGPRLAHSGLSLQAAIVVHTAQVFFLPMVALGTVSPQVLRLSVRDLEDAGPVAGRLYAFSTLGALAGTFTTGWFLVSWLGVHRLLLITSVGLALLGALLGTAWRRPRLLWATTGLLGGAAVFVWAGLFNSLCTEESDFFCIRVTQTELNGERFQSLQLDHLVHSTIKLDDPGYLGYPHNAVGAKIVAAKAWVHPHIRVLVIGGGGYVVPRWVENRLPSVRVEVVEIDPAVTRIALTRFGIRPDTRILSHTLDARQFVAERAPPGAYDVIIQDAVNDLSVPAHLMTREYNERIRALLAPGGVYLLSVLDELPRGLFLRAAILTVRKTFHSVQVIPEGAWDAARSGGFVLVGSEAPLEMGAFRSALAAQGLDAGPLQPVSPQALADFVAREPGTVLTDAYAPVDNLLADVFSHRAREKRARESH
jgi:predicted membrane-bound spermidine synthase